jgi:NAD(P)-dependent dehydrogenase (short-subunit alcohol dehydrogenase family)
MNGKIVLVTGATDGLGKASALELARMGAQIVIVGRNPSKTDSTVREIKAQSGNEQVEKIVADLSSLSEIRKVADIFQERHDRLHVLMNNVGAVYMQRETSVDGLERTFALNHLSYFLLTNWLLDALKTAAAQDGEARVVNVSSEAHRTVRRLDFDDLQRVRRYSGFEVYRQTKLMNILFTYELSRRLEGTGITANALHPGLVATSFGQNNKGLWRILHTLFQRLFGKSPEEGAETQLYVASAPELQGITGKYFSGKREARSSNASYDVEAQQRLWAVSEQDLDRYAMDEAVF